jgi:hypothetical protein
MKPLEPTVDGHRAYLGLLVMAGWERLPLPVILRAVNHGDDAEDQAITGYLRARRTEAGGPRQEGAGPRAEAPGASPAPLPVRPSLWHRLWSWLDPEGLR